MNIYLIGSLRNPEVPKLANRLRAEGWDVFDDWYAAGPEADDKWREYEKGRGHTYLEALGGLAATHIFDFDLRHLHRSDAAVLVLPAGRSGHLELGYAIGTGKPGYILLDNEPDRYDVMYKFANGVYSTLDELITALESKSIYLTLGRYWCSACHILAEVVAHPDADIRCLHCDQPVIRSHGDEAIDPR